MTVVRRAPSAGPARPADPLTYRAVLVCADPDCPGATRAVDQLRDLVRLTPLGILVRTGHRHPCGPPGADRAAVVLVRTDRCLRPVDGRADHVLDGGAPDLRARVARWLMTVEVPA